MPGIPRSKGCINCRQRKIRCDQTKPACLRCSTTNRECKGYAQKETIFINCAAPEEIKKRRRTELPAQCRRRSTVAVAFPEYHSLGSDTSDDFLTFPQTNFASWKQENDFTGFGSWQSTDSSDPRWMYPSSELPEMVCSEGSSPSVETMENVFLTDSRLAVFYDGLEQRKSILIPSQDWHQAGIPESDSSYMLLDALVHLPYMLEQADNLRQYPLTGPANITRINSLIQGFTSLLAELQQWYQHAESTTSEMFYWPNSPSVSSQSSSCTPQTSPLEFPSLYVARLLILFWLSHSIIYAELERLISLSEDTDLNQLLQGDHPVQNSNGFMSIPASYGGGLQKSYSAKAAEFADLVIRSERFCYDLRFGMAGLQTIGFPVWTAKSILEGRTQRRFQSGYGWSPSLCSSEEDVNFLELIAETDQNACPPLVGGEQGHFVPLADVTTIPAESPFPMDSAFEFLPPMAPAPFLC